MQLMLDGSSFSPSSDNLYHYSLKICQYQFMISHDLCVSVVMCLCVWLCVCVCVRVHNLSIAMEGGP